MRFGILRYLFSHAWLVDRLGRCDVVGIQVLEAGTEKVINGVYSAEARSTEKASRKLPWVGHLLVDFRHTDVQLLVARTIVGFQLSCDGSRGDGGHEEERRDKDRSEHGGGECRLRGAEAAEDCQFLTHPYTRRGELDIGWAGWVLHPRRTPALRSGHRIG
jgi:hypothetical protein